MNINYDMMIDNFSTLSHPLQVALGLTGTAILIVSIISIVVSIILSVSYVKFNRRKNSNKLTGEKVARQLLDANGLKNIKVTVTGSMMFGNSYSHYFKKVRIRRFTKNKESLTALAIGSQKAALAVLDKENDPDMKKRIRLTPVIYLGPLAFIPLIIVGVVLDVLLFNSNGYCTAAFSIVGLAFYLVSILLTFATVKTEKKAQVKACQMLRENGLATDKEIADMKKLFRLYNIQYINDTILAVLEFIYYALQIFAMFSSNSSTSTSSIS